MIGVHVPLTEPLKLGSDLLALDILVLVSFTAILRDIGQGSVLPTLFQFS